jgi:hypothetical protein
VTVPGTIPPWTLWFLSLCSLNTFLCVPVDLLIFLLVTQYSPGPPAIRTRQCNELQQFGQVGLASDRLNLFFRFPLHVLLLSATVFLVCNNQHE